MFKLKRKENTGVKPRKTNNRNLLGLVFSVLIAICVFVGLTSYQTTILSSYEKVTRVVAIKDVPSGILITSENVSNYFTVDEIEARHDVTTPIENLNDLVGYISQSEIACGQTVSLINFTEKDHILAEISDVVYMSFNVSKAGDALGGTIREGNIIDVDVATNDGVIEAGKSMYVNSVYDANYVRLSDSDTAPAVTIEVAISASEVDDFVSAISNGTVYVSRRE